MLTQPQNDWTATDQSYYYMNRHEHLFPNKEAFRLIMGPKTGYLCRHDETQPHGPDNSYWGDKKPRPRLTAGYRTPRWHLQKNGALTLVMPTGRHLDHGKAKTSEWIALCDCGRPCRVTTARFRRRRHCRHAKCPYKRVLAVNHGEQPRNPAIDALLADIWAQRPLQQFYPLFS